MRLGRSPAGMERPSWEICEDGAMTGQRQVTVVVVGGGHNGLAMSKRLSDRGVDHVVLEKRDVAGSWRTQRWDSFTMLTPNWQARLPGRVYDGDDPDGFMTGSEVVGFIQDYADTIEAPVEVGSTVTAVRPIDDGYDVVTDQGTWRCRCVVLAGGACNLPVIPDVAAAVPAGVTQINPLEYRHPGQLADGGVLVIGAAATGLQLAEEIQASGRPVTLSVGEHVRMPRTYRGSDIQHWMEAIGRLDERYDESRTSSRPARWRRHNSSALLNVELSISTPSPTRGCNSGADSARSVTGWRCSRVGCETTARWPTRSWAACSTTSTDGSPSRAWVVAREPQSVTNRPGSLEVRR